MILGYSNALKKINAGDVKQIVRKFWTSGTTYDYYRSDYSITNPPKHAQGTSLYSSNYFIGKSILEFYCLKMEQVLKIRW